MMAVMTEPTDFKTRLYEVIDSTTQGSRGNDIDTLIEQIAETKFECLAEDYKSDQADKARFQKIKGGLMIASVALAVISVVAAVASIFFSAGTIAAGSLALAAASGMVSITTSFKQLDSTIEKFVLYYTENHAGKTKINKIKKKVENVTHLLHARIRDLKNVDGSAQEIRAGEILDQVGKVNGFIKSIKENVPEKIMDFDVLDPSPLIAVMGS
jgi:hypothetical protein